MKNSIILGLISLLALSAVGTLSNVSTPALAAEKYAEDKINKIYEICDKLIDYYDDYKFGDDKTYNVYKLCEKLVYEIPIYDSYDPYDPYNTSD
ncbi:MAG: hypothetical protein K0S67_1289 [Nitrososphaeraceae archaeon]|jgi:hypothetical protein|nr:hypothetical protein [Nitrososphaeraceae archaeon]MCD6037401.1 hypothetical protein [Nitrososphaeraceae archaeon]MDF2770152.1 hypothetical protein [Nitrososphaeraceae archaeon]